MLLEQHKRVSLRLAVALFVVVFLTSGLAESVENKNGKAELQLVAAKRGEGVAFKLSWPSQVIVDSRKNSKSLWLRFDRPLESKKLSRQFRSLAKWVPETRYGYDSMLLTWAEGLSPRVVRHGHSVTVVLSENKSVLEPGKGAQSARSMPSEERAARGLNSKAIHQPSVRIQLLRAEALLESGEPEKARSTLEKLREKQPNNSSIIMGLARAEEMLGNWPQSVSYYEQLSESPKERSFALRQLGRLLREHGNSISVGAYQRDVEDADEQVVREVEGRYRVSDRWTLTGKVQQRDLTLEGVRDVSGIELEEEQQKSRASIGLEHISAQGNKTSLAVLGHEDGVGIEATHRIRHKKGHTELGLRSGEPYWDYVEGIFNDASRDQLSISHQHQLNARSRVFAEIAANKFHVKDNSDIAESVSGKLGGAYVLRQKEPTVEVAYAFEKEEIKDLKSFTDDAGEAFDPLPLNDRQAHSLSIHVSDRIGDKGFYSSSVGYLDDAENSSGVFATGKLGVRTKDGLELGVKASSSVSETSSDDAGVTEVGGYMTWYPRP